MQIPEKQISLSLLRRNNGDRSAPKWVAVHGIVYDVTDCPKWKNEMHEHLHFPGQELTEELAEAPHSESVFSHPCVKVIGRLQQ